MRNLPRSERPAPAAPREPSPRARARQPEQPTTFSQFARSQADEMSQGRFAAEQKQTVTGTTPAQQWPELPPSSPWHGTDPTPDEPPTGRCIDAMPELGQDPTGGRVSPSVATGPTSADAPSVVAPRDEQRADVGLFSQKERRDG